MSRKDLLAAFAAAVIAGGTLPPPDLDVAIPPGSPFDWGAMIPAITPRSEPLFPVTGTRDGPPRTVATQRAAPLDLRLTSAGVLRVLTWDIEAHLPWVQRMETVEPPAVTGRGDLPGTPVISRQLQWVCLVPLLRVMLHPALVSRAETIAHLRELGDPVLAMLDAAAAETALTELCTRIGKDVFAPATAPPAPRAGITDEETMLHRFVVRELLAAHPHDPEATFGRRLFLFGDTMAPYVAAYTEDAHPLLRRNAVAALGRYRTSDAAATLVRLAAGSGDPVVRARALAAIGRQRFAVPIDALGARLEKTTDRADSVAIVQTLGSLGNEGAVPAILAHAKKHATDSDVVLATALALARIPTGEHAAAAKDWLAKTLRSAEANPRAFLPEGPQFPVSADIPDPPDMRARMVAQLALLGLARAEPEHGHATKALRLAGEASKSARVGPLRGLHANDSLGSVLPVAQPLYLDILSTLGAKGAELLQRIARDPETDPVLRAGALSWMPGAEGSAIAEEILLLESEPAAIRSHALAVLVRDGGPRLEGLARMILAGKPGTDEALLLAALSALHGLRKLATDEIVLRLERLARQRGPAEPFEVTLRKDVEALVETCASPVPRAQVTKRIDALLDFVIAAGLNPRISAATKTQARQYVQGQLAAVRARKADTAYLKLVAAAVYNYLVGTVVTSLEQKLEFRPYVPLEESLLLMLGRAGDPLAITTLAQRLRERADPHRAVVCLALGSTGRREAASHLVPALLDPEPFVRLCAYLSLKSLTGQVFFADWWAGTRSDQAAAADQYARWIASRR